MAATITVTGTVGDARTLTAAVFTNVSEFTINANTNMLYFVQNGAYKEVSVNAATTVTATKSVTTWTLTIS
jgi:hypothetical protein